MFFLFLYQRLFLASLYFTYGGQFVVFVDIINIIIMKGETPLMIDNKPFLPLSSSTRSEKKKERQKSLPSIAESSDDEYDNIVKKIKDTDVLKTVLKNTISSVSDQVVNSFNVWINSASLSFIGHLLLIISIFFISTQPLFGVVQEWGPTTSNKKLLFHKK
jgi:hypothetical protein